MKKHTFDSLLKTVIDIENGINSLEESLNIHMDQNWMTEASTTLVNTICEGFFDDPKADGLDDLIECIYELVFRVIYDKPDMVYSVSSDKGETICNGHADLYNTILWCIENNIERIVFKRKNESD